MDASIITIRNQIRKNLNSTEDLKYIQEVKVTSTTGGRSPVAEIHV